MLILDMSEISKSEVNTLLQMENNLSLALVFVRDHKIKKVIWKLWNLMMMD